MTAVVVLEPPIRMQPRSNIAARLMALTDSDTPCQQAFEELCHEVAPTMIASLATTVPLYHCTPGCGGTTLISSSCAGCLLGSHP